MVDGLTFTNRVGQHAEMVELLHPTFRRACEKLWSFREEMIGEDMVPTVSFFKDDVAVLTTMCAEVDQDMGLLSAQVGTAPTQADMVVAHFDVTRAGYLANPLTGEAWKRGEMQKVLEQDHLPGMSTCVLSVAVWPDQTYQMFTRSYSGYGSTFAWDDAGSEYSTKVDSPVVRRLLTLWDSPLTATYNQESVLPLFGLAELPTTDEQTLGILVACVVLIHSGLSAAIFGDVLEGMDRETFGKFIDDVATSPLAAECQRMAALKGWSPPTRWATNEEDLRQLIGEDED